MKCVKQSDLVRSVKRRSETVKPKDKPIVKKVTRAATVKVKVSRAVTVAPALHAREKAVQARVRHTTAPRLPPLDQVLAGVAAAVARRGVCSARAMLDHLARRHPGYGTAAGKQWKLREALAFAVAAGTMRQVTPATLCTVTGLSSSWIHGTTQLCLCL